MKAIIKKTGELIEVTRNNYGAYVDENCVGYNLKDLVFEHEEDEHWQEVRERAAIAAMQGLLSCSKTVGNVEDFAEAAVDHANALVKELKKE